MDKVQMYRRLGDMSGVRELRDIYYEIADIVENSNVEGDVSCAVDAELEASAQMLSDATDSYMAGVLDGDSFIELRIQHAGTMIKWAKEAYKNA